MAILALVKARGARIERGAVDDDERRAAGQPRLEEPHLVCRGKERESRNLARLRIGGDDRGEAGQENARVEAHGAQRSGQGGADIAEAAGLRDRRTLGGDEEAFQSMSSPRRRGARSFGDLTEAWRGRVGG